MFKKFSLYIFIFIILFSLSLLFNVLSYKKYYLNFTVYSDNISEIDSIVHNMENSSNPLFSSIFYARSTSGQYIVGLKSNYLEDSKKLLEKIRKGFQLASVQKLQKFYTAADYFLDSMDMDVRYDRKKIQSLIMTNQKFFEDLSLEIYEKLDYNDKKAWKEEKFLKRMKEVFKFEDKDTENIDSLIKYLIYFISDKGISDIQVEINQDELISFKEIFLSFIFSLIFTLTFYSVRRI